LAFRRYRERARRLTGLSVGGTHIGARGSDWKCKVCGAGADCFGACHSGKDKEESEQPASTDPIAAAAAVRMSARRDMTLSQLLTGT